MALLSSASLTWRSFSTVPSSDTSSTPSAAAEIVVPRALDEARILRTHAERLLTAVTGRFARERERLEDRAGRPVLARPRLMLEGLQQRLDDVMKRLSTSGARSMERELTHLGSLWDRLEALSPVSTLQRGYSITLDAGGNLLSSVDGVSPGDLMELVLSDGRVDARAEKVRRDDDDT